VQEAGISSVYSSTDQTVRRSYAWRVALVVGGTLSRLLHIDGFLLSQTHRTAISSSTREVPLPLFLKYAWDFSTYHKEQRPSVAWHVPANTASMMWYIPTADPIGVTLFE